MKDDRYYETVMVKLNEIIKSADSGSLDIGENLYMQACISYDILENKNSSPEDKHAYSILAEYLIGVCKDFPRKKTTSNKGRK